MNNIVFALEQDIPPEVPLPALNPPDVTEQRSTSNLRLTYAVVLTQNVPVYSQIWHHTAGITPTRNLGNGFLWISLYHPDPITWENETWYWINAEEFVQAKYLSIYNPSNFQGLYLNQHPQKPIAWLVSNTWTSSAAGEEPAQVSTLLYRYSVVIIHEIEQVGDWQWYKVGENQWVEQRKVGAVWPATTRPEGVAETDRWIDINLYEQTLAAYEGDQMVYATLISSGLPRWPTKQGLFRIWIKVKQAKMSGRVGLPDYYYLEDVPWTMYFHGSYALHAAYWHNSFGFAHSHGCVNLAPQDAHWLFNWVTPTAGWGNWTPATEESPGTWVWVHE